MSQTCVQRPQLCPLNCLTPILPQSRHPGVRGLIADLCNHMVDVHRAGPREAWSFGMLRFPIEARAWEREVLEQPELPFGDE